MAAFGWFCLVAGLTMISAGYCFMIFNNLGTYTIGGAHNTIATRVRTIIGGVFLVRLWMLLIDVAPFAVTVNAG
jgi:hypothetical protein